MNENERRLAFADFLRKQRAHLSPTDVGLPPGLRRRTPGLRREEVAQLANIGSSWYVWLEQGRNVHPSAQVLESLAQALRLTPNERRHLFLLAGQPLPAHAFPAEERASPLLQQVLDDLNPIPAYVMGRRWDYLAWNRAADSVFTISNGLPPYTHNLVWQIFMNPISQTCFPDWEQKTRGILAEFRASNSCYPGDRWFEELIEDLKQASADFCRLWPHHDAPRSMNGHKTMEHPALGHLEFEHITLQFPGDPDIRIMIFTPDAVTRAKLGKSALPDDHPGIGQLEG
jgi:transcriptional regulator with XRE-family HTH domain